MAKPVATQEQVFEVADRIAAAGEDPTLVTVQAQIGGSYTTVKRYLEAWKAQRATATPAIEVPAEISEQGQALTRAVWAAASTLAEQRIAQARATAAAEVEEARAALGAAEAEISRLESDAEAQAQRLRESEQSAAALRDELAEAQRAATVAEARAGELVKQVGELRAEIEAANARAELASDTRLASELAAIKQQLLEQAQLIATLSRGRDGQE